MNAAIRELICVRCGSPLACDLGPGAGTPVALFEGCPRCEAEGQRANLTVELDLGPMRAHLAAGGALAEPSAPGLWRYGSLLPVDPAHRISLGEGNTPLIKLERFGRRIGLSELYVKDESRQPTWSYKDRLCAVAVAKARELGAKVIAVSSTGNHGAATAAYAARAGLPCVVFTNVSVPAVMTTLMQSYGAYVLALANPWDRYKLMAEGVRRFGWYPTSGYVFPPIGSNPFGIEGYKTISFEIHEQLGRVPEFVSVPTCYGDGLLGIWKGWRELCELGLASVAPKMIAAEVFGSLEAAFQRGDLQPSEMPTAPTPAFSISTPIGTHQSVLALRQSEGLPCGVLQTDLIDMQRQLARDEGIFAEASSITALAAVARMRKEGRLDQNATIVAVITSTGLKDPGATAGELPPVPVVEPDLIQAGRALREIYGVELF